ncbi:MAG: beta strand repeat-containing protein, partial [Candidatus Nanopelagicus sp.]
PVEAFTVVDTRTLTLTSISGTFTVNETVTGATSAATGTVLKVNLNNIVIRGLTGTFSSSEGITGGTSTATATTTSVTINEGSGILFSEAPTAASILYVVHEGNATYNLVPTAASVGPSQLADNLRNFTVDTFTGDGTTTTFTLSDTPSSANSLLVMVDGIVQTRTTNYTLSGAVVTFTDAPDSSAAITIIHLGFSTISRTGLVDGSVTTSKIADNAITSAKLGFDVIVAEDIAANAITVAEIANGAVTPAKLSTGGPSWASTGQTTINSTSAASAVILNSTNAGGTALNIQNSGTVNSLLGGYNSIVGSGNATDIMLSATQGVLAFGTGASSTERMRIDSSGRLLVGTTSTTTSSSQSGEVYSTGAVGFLLTNTTAANFALSVKNEGTSGTRNLINFYEGTGGGTARANISFDSANSLTFSTAGTARISIPIDAGGIKFPATQSASSNANTLDDYEEGNWTVTDGSGAGLTISQSGVNFYTKIGRMVYLSLYVTYPTTSNSNNAAINLPFMANTAGSYGYLVGRAQNNISGGPIVWQIGGGGSTATCSVQNNSAPGSVTNSQLSGSYILVSGWYTAPD